MLQHQYALWLVSKFRITCQYYTRPSVFHTLQALIRVKASSVTHAPPYLRLTLETHGAVKVTPIATNRHSRSEVCPAVAIETVWKRRCEATSVEGLTSPSTETHFTDPFKSIPPSCPYHPVSSVPHNPPIGMPAKRNQRSLSPPPPFCSARGGEKTKRLQRNATKGSEKKASFRLPSPALVLAYFSGLQPSFGAEVIFRLRSFNFCACWVSNACSRVQPKAAETFFFGRDAPQSPFAC